MNTPLVSVIAGAIVLVGLIAATTFLAWHGVLNGQAVIGFFSGLSIAGVVGGAQQAGVHLGARAASGLSNRTGIKETD